MMPLKSFDEFVKNSIARKRSPDIARSNALILEAEKKKIFLDKVYEKVGMTDDDANSYIEATYDIIMELIRSKLLKDGFSCAGEGAHEAEVAYMRKLGFDESAVRLMNDLRFYRNGILYYGKSFDAEYGKKVIGFLRKNYKKLLEIAQN